MRKIISAIAAVSLALPTLSLAAGPKFSNSGGVGSSGSTFQDGEPTGGTYTINGTTGRVSAPVVNLRPGSAPVTPQNGDCWTTIAGFFCQINGVTVGPYASSVGAGTVTQVGLVPPSIFTAGAPVTTTGNLSFTLNSQAANQIFAGPNGSSGIPGFRALVGADIPAINMAGSGNGGVTGTLAIANGGTGSTTAANARTALGLGTMAIQNAGTVAITGGSIAGITDLAVADGGTGASTASAARTNLGASTVGGNLFTLTDPSTVSFPRFNADNTVSALTPTATRAALGVPTIQVASTAVLKLTPSSIGTATRLGFAAAGDAPPLNYVATNAACTTNAGAGDDGWQIPSSDGKCWVAQFGNTADIRQWGLQPGGQADTAMNRAIAFACSTHVPISIPYPGSSPYLLNSQITIGNGSASALSTCNGVTIRVERPYNESTSGTTPPNYMVFRWNGAGSSTIPIVVQGPAAQISLNGISVNCANTAGNHCATGIQINNVIEGRFDNLGVAGNVGVGISLITIPLNNWPGALEGSQFNNISVTAPGTGGSGMDIGITNCVGCTPSTLNAAVIANIFNNVTLNFDGATAGTYGLQLGLVTQSTFTNMRISCSTGSISGDCVPALGPAIKITPVTNRTMFPTDLTFIHPLINGTVTDPGAAWTGDQGITFLNWSTAYRAFPTSTNFDLFKGTDSMGRRFPGARSWTLADASGAGLSLTVQDATYSVTGNTCSVSLAFNYPTTSNGNTASVSGLPARCLPLLGSGTSRTAGTIAYTTYSAAPITALMDNVGQISFYTYGGAAVTNAGMSGKAIRLNFNFPVN